MENPGGQAALTVVGQDNRRSQALFQAMRCPERPAAVKSQAFVLLKARVPLC